MLLSRPLIATVTCGLLLSWSQAASAQEEMSSDPIGDIAATMKSAVARLAKALTDEPTQAAQDDAVKQLDTLIAMLEKECEKCKGARVKLNPTKPAADSTVRSGPGGMGKLHAAEKDGKQWGELPQQERDRILQSMTEGFPAHYQGVLEAYYKRLAEEKPVQPADQNTPVSADSPENASPPPSTQSAK